MMSTLVLLKIQKASTSNYMHQPKEKVRLTYIYDDEGMMTKKTEKTKEN